MIIKPKGTQDIYQNASVFRFIESQFIKIATQFNYSEIRTPIFEASELFNSTIGTDSDIVQKELYLFQDKNNRELALRPEGTAPIARAFIENKLYVENASTKFFYLGSMFRYERPQKGRKREFHQLGIEQIGLANAFTTAEAIILADKFLKSISVSNYNIVINNLGHENDRQEYKKELKKYFSSKLDTLCQDCQTRFELNTLRLLDCKVDKIDDNTPSIDQFINQESVAEFSQVKQLLKEAGIEYTLDYNLVRGLDYYSNTVFEFIPKDSQTSQATIVGGGQYTGLVKKLGGPDVKGVGFAMGIERIVEIIKANNVCDDNKAIDVFVSGEGNNNQIFNITNQLRDAQIKAEYDSCFASMQKQFKKSSKYNPKWAIVVEGEKLYLKSQTSDKTFSGTLKEFIKIIKEKT